MVERDAMDWVEVIEAESGLSLMELMEVHDGGAGRRKRCRSTAELVLAGRAVHMTSPPKAR